jgi:hypothetical protein
LKDKFCTKCEQFFPLNAFGRNSKAKDGLQWWCKTCTNAYQAEVYRRGGKKSLCYKSKQKIFDRNVEFVWDYLETHPCVDCGETDRIVLQFDHVEGFKYKTISKMVYGYSLDNLRKEIALCEVRCANCHIRVTAKRHGGWWKTKYDANKDNWHDRLSLGD